MNLRPVAVLACRILAIVALISVIQASAFLLPLFYEAFNPEKFAVGSGSPIGYFPLSLLMALVFVSPVALLFIFAGFLWMQADFVATKMVGAHDESIASISVDQNAQRLAFPILGAYVLTLALPRLAQLLVHAWNVGSQNATLRQIGRVSRPTSFLPAWELVLHFIFFSARAA